MKILTFKKSLEEYSRFTNKYREKNKENRWLIRASRKP
jgi:hypothetical protein